MMFPDVRIIGFDLDQTLYPKSVEIDEKIQEYINQRIADRLQIAVNDASDRFRALYKDGQMSGGRALMALGFPKDEASNIVQEALERADINEYLLPNPETLAFLERCKKRFAAMDLITGSSRSNAERKLDRLQIPIEWFGQCITADDASKSDGAAYRLWLTAHAEYAAEKFLYIGDRPGSDYEAPKALGIRSVLVNVTKTSADCPHYASMADFDRVLFLQD